MDETRRLVLESDIVLGSIEGRTLITLDAIRKTQEALDRTDQILKSGKASPSPGQSLGPDALMISAVADPSCESKSSQGIAMTKDLPRMSRRTSKRDLQLTARQREVLRLRKEAESGQ